MHRKAILSTALLLASILLAQSTPAKDQSPTVIRSTATIVTVPALVRSRSDEVIHGLVAQNFRLWDNESEQKVSVEESKNQAVAVIVLMQTGGPGHLQFRNYRNLPAWLQAIVGESVHEFMLMTFDSKPEEVWHFPVRSDGLEYGLTHPRPGDDGAAIIDAVKEAVYQFQREPGNFRRIILLLSQTADDASKSSAAELIQQLGKSSTTVYSITFPNAGQTFRSKESAARTPRAARGDSSDALAPERDAGSIPLRDALKAMRKNTAGEIAVLSGGEQFRFHNESDLEEQLSAAADAIHNQYLLTFHPAKPTRGFHALKVAVKANQAHLKINARVAYWPDNIAPEE